MRAVFLAGGVLGLLALVPAGGPGGTACAADRDLLGALKRVEGVRLEGNVALGDGTIRKLLKTGGSDFLGLRSAPLYRPDFLRTDVRAIQSLYTRQGYLDAIATASADSGSRPGSVIVTYRIVEGPRVFVRSVAFDSTAMFDDRDLADAVALRPGIPFDPVQVPLGREALAALYAGRGHFPAIDTDVRRDGQSVDVRFVIRDGPAYRVGAVDVIGVQRVDTSAVRREVLLARGDLYRRDRLVESSERLSGSGLFTTVELEPAAPDSANGRVDLVVRVRERKPRWIEGGVGTGTDQIIRFVGQWGHRNLSGDGKALTVDATAGWNSNRQSRLKSEIAFVEPWLLGTRTRGRVAASLERGFDTFAGRTYIQEAAGLSFGASREFYSSRSRVSLVFDNTWTRLARVIPADTTFFLAPYLPRLTVAFDQDRRDDPLVPRRGAINNVSVQFAGALRENTGLYAKIEGLTGWHVPTSRATTLGVRLRGGIIRPLGGGPGGPEGTLARVPVTDRYRVGGTSTVRGYHENGIDAGGNGGALLGVVNVELRRRLYGPLGGLAFVDGGNVWSDPARVRLRSVFGTTGPDGSVGVDDVHWSYGVGANLYTPVGPVRVDYARRFRLDEADVRAGRRERDAFHFAIGFMF